MDRRHGGEDPSKFWRAVATVVEPYRIVLRRAVFRQGRDGAHRRDEPSSMDDRLPQRVLTKRARLGPALPCWFASVRRGRLDQDGSQAETKGGRAPWRRKVHPRPAYWVRILGVQARLEPCTSRLHRLHRPQAKRPRSYFPRSASPWCALWRRSMSEGRNPEPWNPALSPRRGFFHMTVAPSWSEGTVNWSTWTSTVNTSVNTSAHFQ